MLKSRLSDVQVLCHDADRTNTAAMLHHSQQSQSLELLCHQTCRPNVWDCTSAAAAAKVVTGMLSRTSTMPGCVSTQVANHSRIASFNSTSFASETKQNRHHQRSWLWQNDQCRWLFYQTMKRQIIPINICSSACPWLSWRGMRCPS